VPKAIVTDENSPLARMEEVAGRLESAMKKVVANKGAPGPDAMTVAKLREQWPSIAARLRAGLLSGTYRSGGIRRAMIPKADGGQRALGIPNVVDRVVMEAVRQVLEPLFEPTFHASSHGFRPGRSCHTAVAEAKRHVRAGHEWVVDIDLEKFFDRQPPAADRQTRAASRRPAAARADRTHAQGQGRAAGRCRDRRR
jgi:retron-type reverse transcriptase